MKHVLSSKSLCIALALLLLVGPLYSGGMEQINGYTTHSQQFLQNMTMEVEVIAPAPQTSSPSEIVTYQFDILNNGSIEDSYEWSLESEHGWITSGSNGVTPLIFPNEYHIFNVTIQVPEHLEDNTIDRLYILVQSTTNESVDAEAHTYTRVVVREVEVRAPAPQEGKVFETKVYRFEIINRGWVEDSYSWSAYSGHDWITSQSNGTVHGLGVNETHHVYISITIPDVVQAHTVDELTLTAVSLMNSSVSDSDTTYTYVSEIHSMRIDPPPPMGRPPNSEFIMTFNLTNTGNVKGTSYTLSSFVDNDFWETRIVSKNPTPLLDPGESTLVDVFVSIPDVTVDYELEKMDIYYGATKDIVLRVEAPNGFINSSLSPVTVTPYFSVDLRAREPYLSIEYGTTTTRVEFVLEVTNLCNILDEDIATQTISLSEEDRSFISPVEASEEERRWSLSISNPEVQLKGGEMRKVLVVVTAPREPLNGTFFADILGVPDPHIDLSGVVNTDTCEIGVNVNQRGIVEVESKEPEKFGKPAEWVYYNYTIKNMGNGIDRFLLEVSTENGWESEILDDLMTDDLHPGESVNATIRVKVPDMVPVGFRERVRLTAISIFERDFNTREVTDHAESILIVDRGYSVMLKPSFNETSTFPNESAIYELTIINTGNTRDTIALSLVYEPSDNWEVELVNDIFVVERWNQTVTYLMVTPDDGAIHEQPFNVTIIATSRGDPTKTDDAIALTHVIHVPDMEVSLNRTHISIKPGEMLNSTLIITNTGNGNDTLLVEGNISNHYWDLYLEMDSLSLSPGETGMINVTITAPGMPEELDMLDEMNLTAGSVVVIGFNITSEADPSVNRTLLRDVHVEQLRIHEITSSGAEMDALPGREAKHEIKVKNLGNSFDNVTLNLYNSSSPYADYSYLDRDVVGLDIGESQTVNLTVGIPVSLRPYWHQIVNISVANADLSAETWTFTRVVMMDVDETSRQIKIGRSASFDISVVNLPNRTIREEGIGIGDPLADIIRMSGTFITEALDEDWDISFESEEISFTESYETETVTVVLGSPLIEYPNIQRYRITGESLHTDVGDAVITSIEVFWFDLVADGISITPTDGGRYLDVIVDIRISGMELIHEVPFEIWIQGEIIPEEDIELMEILIGTNEEIRTYGTRYDLGKWSWSKISRTVEVDLIVDPDDEFYEINALGTADENNEIRRSKMVSKYMDIPQYIPFLILIISLSCLLVSWKGFKNEDLLVIPMGISLAGLLGSLLLMPWGSTLASSTAVNELALVLVVIALGVFVISLIAFSFYLKSFLNLVIKYLVRKKGWGEYFTEHVSDDEEYYPHLYYVIMGSCGGLMLLTFLLITGINNLIRGEIQAVFFNTFFNAPVLFFVVLYFALGFCVSLIVVRIYERLTAKVVIYEKTFGNLRERAKEEAKIGGEIDGS